MSNFTIRLLAICATIIIFFISRWLNEKYPHPLTLPVLVSTIILAVGLLLFKIPYETYNIGGQWIERFLGPAVVALAYPLYQHRKILRKIHCSCFRRRLYWLSDRRIKRLIFWGNG